MLSLYTLHFTLLSNNSSDDLHLPKTCERMTTASTIDLPPTCKTKTRAPSTTFLSGPLATNSVAEILHYWQYLADEQLQAGYSLGKRVQRNNEGPGFLFSTQRSGRASLNLLKVCYEKSVAERDILCIVLLRVRHYCLCMVDLSVAPHLVRYTILDSSRYDNSTRSDRVNGKFTTILKDVQKILQTVAPERVSKETTFHEWKRKEPRGIATQSNDVDCGVFTLFYLDCIRRGVAIKDSLTDADIIAYRSYLEQQYRFLFVLRQQTHIRDLLEHGKVEADVIELE